MLEMNVNEYWTYVQDGWRPALEIFILAVAIYCITRFLRGTRGWPVVIGFVVALLVLFAAAEVLNLMVLRWLLGAAYTFFAFAVLIIFQPELRRLLAEWATCRSLPASMSNVKTSRSSSRQWNASRK